MCECSQYPLIFEADLDNLNLFPHKNVNITNHGSYLEVRPTQNNSTPGIKTGYLTIKPKTHYIIFADGYATGENLAFFWCKNNIMDRRLYLDQGPSIYDSEYSTKKSAIFYSEELSSIEIGILFTGQDNDDRLFLEDLRLYEAKEQSFSNTVFQTMFNCPALEYDSQILTDLGNSMLISNNLTSLDLNNNVPLGFVFLGQFIAHELTLNVSDEFKSEAKNYINFRTPIFDLDQVYGQFENNKFMYDENHKLLWNQANNDLLRNENGVPIIGDPRNDENFAIAQLQLVFIKFHNKVMDYLQNETPSLSGLELFNEARKTVRWHFQYLVIHNFLKNFISPAVVDQILNEGAKFYTNVEDKYIPTEFVTACYRFGHAILTNDIQIDSDCIVDLHTLLGLTGGNLPGGERMDWNYLFYMPGSGVIPKMSKKINPKIVEALHTLPNGFPQPADLPHNSLPVRNLRRGNQFNIGSGQHIAKQIKEKYPHITPLTSNQVNNGNQIFNDHPELKSETPLFYYFLREAEVQEWGQKLGHVGSIIIGEVIVEAIRRNPKSYLYEEPNWTPTLPRADQSTFTIMDLIDFTLNYSI